MMVVVVVVVVDHSLTHSLVHSLVTGTDIKGDAIVVYSTQGHHLFNMLRPEHVRTSPAPLSSDAFTGFGLHDRMIHNPEVGGGGGCRRCCCCYCC